MSSSFASSSFGNSGQQREFISFQARAILVEEVLARSTASATRQALKESGINKSLSAVTVWMRQTRQWLGLPALYPSKISDRYRIAVENWIEEHGVPSREEIIAGWTPGSKTA